MQLEVGRKQVSQQIVDALHLMLVELQDANMQLLFIKVFSSFLLQA